MRITYRELRPGMVLASGARVTKVEPCMTCRGAPPFVTVDPAPVVDGRAMGGACIGSGLGDDPWGRTVEVRSTFPEDAVL